MLVRLIVEVLAALGQGRRGPRGGSAGQHVGDRIRAHSFRSRLSSWMYTVVGPRRPPGSLVLARPHLEVERRVLQAAEARPLQTDRERESKTVPVIACVTTTSASTSAGTAA
jgi:hypothetical protein